MSCWPYGTTKDDIRTPLRNLQKALDKYPNDGSSGEAARRPRTYVAVMACNCFSGLYSWLKFIRRSPASKSTDRRIQSTERERQTDIQKRETDREADRQTDSQTYWLTETETEPERQTVTYRQRHTKTEIERKTKKNKTKKEKKKERKKERDGQGQWDTDAKDGTNADAERVATSDTDECGTTGAEPISLSRHLSTYSIIRSYHVLSTDIFLYNPV